MLSSNPTSSPSIHELLATVSFPITKTELLEHMRMNRATALLLDPIEKADVKRFDSPQAVMAEIQKG